MNSSAVRTEPGMRFSFTDFVVLAVAALGAWRLFSLGHPLWWIVVAVVGHFFLFCNVFRVRRTLELWWAVVFVVNVSACFAFGKIDWWPAMGLQLPVTILVICLELRSSSYHGIGAQWINPKTNPEIKN